MEGKAGRLSIAAADASLHPDASPPVTQPFPKLANIVTINFFATPSIPKGEVKRKIPIKWSDMGFFDNQGEQSRTRPGCRASIDQQEEEEEEEEEEASDAGIGKVGKASARRQLDQQSVMLCRKLPLAGTPI